MIYPKEEAFNSYEEMKEYFNTNNKIPCLRCGKMYHVLGKHLSYVHGWHPDEYREFYGIPYRKALNSKRHSKTCAGNSKRRFEAGEMKLTIPQKGDMPKGPKPRIFKFRGQLNRMVTQKSYGSTPEECKKTFEAIMVIIHDEMTSKKVMLNRAIAAKQIISYDCFKKYLTKYPELRAKHEDVINSLPNKIKNSCGYVTKKRKNLK